jgi:glycosyltransferase involved in cell wall biosynthesis
MRSILAFGFHDPQSPRHWTLRKHYALRGMELVECRTEATGFFRKCSDLVRQFRWKGKGTQAVLVTFPGHHLVWLAWLLTHLRPMGFAGQARTPRPALMFDAFISVYDTLVTDRKKIAPWSPVAWFVWLTDYVDCHLADEILVDTQAHKAFFCRAFHLHPSRVRVIYLEAPDDVFHPGAKRERNGDECRVLFYGSYIPLQGIETILHAAALLQEKQFYVRFTLVGGGQTYAAMRALAEDLRLTNVAFTPFVPQSELPAMIRAADIVLGIFGTGGKTQRVIPHKVVEAMACGSTVITADTPAIRERYRDGEGIHLVPTGDAEELAEKIVELSERNGQRAP